MIHFFPTFSGNPEATPFGLALRRLGVTHRLYGARVRKHYRNRLQLVLICLPQLAVTALRMAVRSLVLARPYPDAVVLGSDIEVLVFSLVRCLFLRPKLAIVYQGFIYTSRRNAVIEAVRRGYYAAVLRRVDCAVCHSGLETVRYAAMFAASATKFVFIPWGTNITIRDRLIENPSAFGFNAGGYIVSAGKSGRDYATLFRAMEGVPFDLHVICDLSSVLAETPVSDRVQVFSSCYGEDYLLELFRSRFVVVPLAVDDISAGQMVLVQAMALGKAVIVTRSPTIEEYVTDGHDAVLVPRGDEAALKRAILCLAGDPGLCARLGANAMATYEARFRTERHVAEVVRVTEELLQARSLRSAPGT